MDMTPTELGESLAQLVWESFTDFIAAHEMPDENGGDTAVLTAPEVVPEEVLILFMWVHTRACQQAFNGRAASEDLKAVLDQFHAAVFQDLQDEILPRAQLPIFEQRVSARYTEYYEAASQDADERVVEAAWSWPRRPPPRPGRCVISWRMSRSRLRPGWTSRPARLSPAAHGRSNRPPAHPRSRNPGATSRRWLRRMCSRLPSVAA
jgi:hypothetical protein